MHDLELYSKMYSENNYNFKLFILRCQIMLSKTTFWTNQTWYVYTIFLELTHNYLKVIYFNVDSKHH